MVCEVTTLEHEVGDDTVEAGASIAEALLTSGKSAEVLSSLGNDIVVELKDDAAKGSYHRASPLAYQLFLYHWERSRGNTYRRRRRRRSKPGAAT